MKKILTIAKKEYLAYLTNPAGYILGGLFLLVSSWLYFQDFFLIKQADVSNLWIIMIFLFTLLIPAISMNLFSDEKRNGNWEIILSLPVSEKELVLGKFLGSLGYLLTVSMLIFPVILTVNYLGDPEWGLVVGGGLGLGFLAASYLACGLLGSSLSSQPIVGFMVTTVILLVNNFIGQDFFLAKIQSNGLASFLAYLSLSRHGIKMGSGLIGLDDVAFYFSWISIFLILTVVSLKSRDR